MTGSIHYPRSAPEMWPDLIQKAKEGGLDPGKYYFEGNYDLVKFIKLVQQAGLYAHPRIGRYACAEWNFGGFPVWLKFIPGISFRTDNEPFKFRMQRFTTKIVDMMKAEKLFESQGAPIILSQVENEYGPVEEIGSPGKAYTQWAADMAVGLGTGVPWVMCRQDDAPDPLIITCKGFYCDYFSPNNDYKPKMWTEAWTGWFTEFGGPVPHRPAEDMASSVAGFIQKGGSFVNYYMCHGGTNFGRTAGGPFIATSFDYDAPLDEYAHQYLEILLLHRLDILKSLMSSNQNWELVLHSLQTMIQDLLQRILPDCKHTAYNTARVGAQTAQLKMTFVPIRGELSWDSFNEDTTSTYDSSFTSGSCSLYSTLPNLAEIT
ncbi:hypothetical protein K1719_018862 [Acacia pycnantha]|nr:hypothetical protein K1719_018862 [Acacia pycnantha]